MEKDKRYHLVVTISRLMASGGSYIGQQLASRLGCSYLDRDILVEAAKRLNADPEALDKLDGKKVNFWERIKMEFSDGFPSHPFVPPSLHHLQDYGLFGIEKSIIREAASRGPVVVVGRAGYYVCRKEPGLLSVFLHAPLPYRIEKTREFYFTERNNLRSEEEAKRVLHEADRAQAEFIKGITGKEIKDLLDPRNFDLCLNTCKLGWDQTLEIIYNAALAVQLRLHQHEMAHA